jgi:hypothetical protein
MDNDDFDADERGDWRANIYHTFAFASIALALLIALAIDFDKTIDFGQRFGASHEASLLTLLALGAWLVCILLRRYFRRTHNATAGMLYGFLMVLMLTAATVSSFVSLASSIVAFPSEWQAFLRAPLTDGLRHWFYPGFAREILGTAALVAVTAGVVYTNAFRLDLTSRR